MKLHDKDTFEIRYISRKENDRVDTLSRRLDYIEGKEVLDKLNPWINKR